MKNKRLRYASLLFVLISFLVLPVKIVLPIIRVSSKHIRRVDRKRSIAWTIRSRSGGRSPFTCSLVGNGYNRIAVWCIRGKYKIRIHMIAPEVIHDQLIRIRCVLRKGIRIRTSTTRTDFIPSPGSCPHGGTKAQ